MFLSRYMKKRTHEDEFDEPDDEWDEEDYEDND